MNASTIDLIKNRNRTPEDLILWESVKKDFYSGLRGNVPKVKKKVSPAKRRIGITGSYQYNRINHDGTKTIFKCAYDIKKFGYDISCVRQACDKKTRHKGFKWERAKQYRSLFIDENGKGYFSEDLEKIGITATSVLSKIRYNKKTGNKKCGWTRKVVLTNQTV